MAVDGRYFFMIQEFPMDNHLILRRQQMDLIGMAPPADADAG